MGYFHNPTIVRDGLVLYLDAANKRSYSGSGTEWKDLSGNNYSGSLNNGPIYTTDNFGSIVFDGVDDSCNFGNVLNIGLSDWTYGCWFKLSNSLPTQGIFGKTSFRSFAGRYAIYIENSQLSTLLQPAGNNFLITTSITPYNDGNWHQILITIDRDSNMSMYTDGKLINSINISSASSVNMNSTDILCLGSYVNNIGTTPSLPFNGSISTAQIYNRVLTSKEILQNYEAKKGRFGL